MKIGEHDAPWWRWATAMVIAVAVALAIAGHYRVAFVLLGLCLAVGAIELMSDRRRGSSGSS